MGLKPVHKSIKRDGWGNHVPILRSLSKFIKIKTVMEFGCGFYSTRTFLDKQYFPDLEKISIYERNKEWKARIQKLTSKDNRVDWIEKDLYQKEDCSYDMALVDGKASERRYIMEKDTRFAKIYLLHDAQRYKHKKYKDNFKYICYIKPIYGLPSSRICSNYVDLDKFNIKNNINWKKEWDSLRFKF